MPTTKKEQLYFGLMMCACMVVAMTFYNLYMNGLFDQISVRSILIQLVVGFVLAFFVESFIVGPVAGKIVFSLPFAKTNRFLGILFMAFFMVLGMVFLMSMYGLGTSYLITGFDGQSILASFFSTALTNFLFAFPLQLILVGPLVRFLFATFVQNQKVVEPR